jgi:hypothetical protein
VSSNIKERLEGVRIKHWLNGNSLKLYDKGSVLRTECMIREPGDFKVYRPLEGDPQGPKDWRPMRKGVADLHRRAEVGQAVNERYLKALTAVQDTTPLRQLVEPLCQPVPEPARHRGSPPAAGEPNPVPDSAPAGQDGAAGAAPSEAGSTEAAKPRAPRPRRVRALNPLAASDAALLEAVSRHEFLINGLRNRNLRRLLYAKPPATAEEQRRRSGAVTRQLRLLRAHGLIHKVPKTHRYIVSESGRRAITALLAARNASADQLTRCAG